VRFSIPTCIASPHCIRASLMVSMLTPCEPPAFCLPPFFGGLGSRWWARFF
jgi:hypothetical protein